VIGLEEIIYDYNAVPDDDVFSLEPLTSKMFKVRFESLPDVTYTGGYEITAGGGSDVRAISYPDDNTPCGSISPSLIELVQVAEGQDITYLVLVSNTSLDSARQVTLSFKPDQAGVTILEPDDGLTFSEGDTIPFLAVVSGIMGDNPSTFQLQWTYSSPGRNFISMGLGENGTYFPYDRLCDGVYQVTATARNASTSQSASDTIQVIVNDLGMSNPPPQCAPEVEIVSPGPGATYKVGDTISLEAVIDDDHPETDDPLYPVTWRADGPGGRILGRGLRSSTKLGEGVDTIYVSYGAASDSVTISVIETENTRPRAVIEQPADGEQFSYTGPGGGSNGYTVTFAGYGDDDQDGSLPGSNLHWSYREEGSSSWIDLGTGSQISYNIRYRSGFTWYVARLEVNDSEGLMGSTEIRFRIQGPPS
jgi:hypothetical protein